MWNIMSEYYIYINTVFYMYGYTCLAKPIKLVDISMLSRKLQIMKNNSRDKLKVLEFARSNKNLLIKSDVKDILLLSRMQKAE